MKNNWQQGKTLAFSSLGGALEFYDFIIFVFFINYISSNFFPSHLGEFWQLLNAYGAFAAGYLARPLGGIVMAHFGDKFGRKNMFMLSILLMVIPTFSLAFIPNFESIGYLAPVLLILVRICQGIAIGGELPGAWVFVKEHAPDGKSNFYLGVLTAFVISGILLGSLVALIMNKLYTPSELNEWAWRVPFFIGGVFGIISIYLRRFLEETPIFLEMHKQEELAKFPLKEVFKSEKSGIFASIGITWVLTTCVVIFILTMPNFLESSLNMDRIDKIYLQMIAIILAGVGAVISGFLGDRIGIYKTTIIFGLGFGISAFFMLYNLYSPNALDSGVKEWYLAVAFFCGLTNVCPMIMCEVFSPKVRFSGLSFGYNISYAISGGVTPQLTLWLHSIAAASIVSGGFGIYVLSIYVVSVAVLAILVAFFVRKRIG